MGKTIHNPMNNPIYVNKIKIKAIERYKNPIFKEKHKLACKEYYNTHEHNNKGKFKSDDTIEKMSEKRKEWYINNPEKAIKKTNKMRNTKIKEKTHSLEKNGMWLGGKSFEPYTKEFNNQFKNLIRKRDNQICMLCGIHREKLSNALNVHHINYNKELSIPQNCISLCNFCHIKTNLNREQWIPFFQSLLNKKYNYQYEDGGEIKISLIKNV